MAGAHLEHPHTRPVNAGKRAGTPEHLEHPRRRGQVLGILADTREYIIVTRSHVAAPMRAGKHDRPAPRAGVPGNGRAPCRQHRAGDTMRTPARRGTAQMLGAPGVSTRHRRQAERVDR